MFDLITALFLVIIIAAVAAYFLKGMIKMKPAATFLLVAVLIGALFQFGGYADFTTGWGTGTTPATTTGCATFDIEDPTITASAGAYNDGSIIIPFQANSTAHGVREADNTTWVDPVIEFSMEPVVPTGATNDDLFTVYAEVTNPDQNVYSGDHDLITYSASEWQAYFSEDGVGTYYVDTSESLTGTGNITFILTLDVDQTGLSYIGSSGDSVTIHVRFYNNCGWSETFDVEFYCLHTAAFYYL